MTDIEAEDQAGEGTDGAAGTGGTTDGGDAEAAGDDRAGTLDAEPGGDAAGGAGDSPGDESTPQDDARDEDAADTESDVGSGPGGGDAAAEAGTGGEPEGRAESGPGGDDAAAEGAATSGDGSRPDDEPGPAEETDAEEGGEQARVSPENRLEALQEDIDAVRRRVAEDTVDQGDQAFVQEGEASEDEPVDDTIAPPG